MPAVPSQEIKSKVGILGRAPFCHRHSMRSTVRCLTGGKSGVIRFDGEREGWKGGGNLYRFLTGNRRVLVHFPQAIFKGQGDAPFRSRASGPTALRALPTARLAALGRQHRTHSTCPAHESFPLTASSGWATQIAMSPLNFLPPPAAPAPSWCLAACSRRARR